MPQAAVPMNTVPFTQMQGAGMVPGGSVSPTINGESHTINASKVFGFVTVDKCLIIISMMFKPKLTFHPLCGRNKVKRRKIRMRRIRIR